MGAWGTHTVSGVPNTWVQGEYLSVEADGEPRARLRAGHGGGCGGERALAVETDHPTEHALEVARLDQLLHVLRAGRGDLLRPRIRGLAARKVVAVRGLAAKPDERRAAHGYRRTRTVLAEGGDRVDDRALRRRVRLRGEVERDAIGAPSAGGGDRAQERRAGRPRGKDRLGGADAVARHGRRGDRDGGRGGRGGHARCRRRRGRRERRRLGRRGGLVGTAARGGERQQREGNEQVTAHVVIMTATTW